MCQLDSQHLEQGICMQYIINCYMSHPSKTLPVLPRHPLKLGITKGSVSFDEVLTFFLKNAHSNTEIE